MFRKAPPTCIRDAVRCPQRCCNRRLCAQMLCLQYDTYGRRINLALCQNQRDLLQSRRFRATSTRCFPVSRGLALLMSDQPQATVFGQFLLDLQNLRRLNRTETLRNAAKSIRERVRLRTPPHHRSLYRAEAKVSKLDSNDL